MGNLENLISESYKFIRMADDLHDVASYLSEMRICFIMLTVTVYLVLLIFLIQWCVKRNQRQMNNVGNGQRRPLPSHTNNNNNNRSHWDYQAGKATDDYQNSNATGQTLANATDELVSVRTDGHVIGGTGKPTTQTIAPSYMGRNRSQAPSFMRHGMHMNHSQQTNTNTSNNISSYGAATSSSNNPTTRLISNSGGGIGETENNKMHHHHHQIPHIVTNEEDDSGILTTTANNATANTPTTALVSLRHHHRGIATTTQDINATEM